MATNPNTTSRALRTVAVAAGLIGAAVVAGATTSATSPTARSGATGARHASAQLLDASGNPVGSAHFVEDGTGRVHVNVKVSGLGPGLHGIHVHSVGACTPTFDAASSHHNPHGQGHGDPRQALPDTIHSGDLPNLKVNGAGQGQLNASTERFTLAPGDDTVFDTNGSALIVHASMDDYLTQPTGASGGRIACGVITPS